MHSASLLHPRELQCSVTAIICDNLSAVPERGQKRPGPELAKENNVEHHLYVGRGEHSLMRH
jgi:hypothetical protein